MNPRPAPPIPGNTEWERFDNAVRKVFSVSPEAIQKEKDRMKAKKAAKVSAKRRDSTRRT